MSCCRVRDRAHHAAAFTGVLKKATVCNAIAHPVILLFVGWCGFFVALLLWAS